MLGYRRPSDTVVDEVKITTTKLTYNTTKTTTNLMYDKQRLDDDRHNERRLC